MLAVKEMFLFSGMRVICSSLALVTKGIEENKVQVMGGRIFKRFL